MEIWVKVAVVVLIAVFVYREILKTAVQKEKRAAASRQKEKAGILTLVFVGVSVGAFVYAGLFVTDIETRDLRPYNPGSAPQMVSIFDKGVIELNGMVIKTSLAEPGELTALADRLTSSCRGDEGCEVQSMFDYVTRIPYKTDHTSRSAQSVIETNWGDCDDKSNLFASLLQERGFDYRFVYVPHHVFVVVHVENTEILPLLPARLMIEGKPYYYAETTAEGARIGEFNGQFPFQFEGVYDIQKHKAVEREKIAFRIG